MQQNERGCLRNCDGLPLRADGGAGYTDTISEDDTRPNITFPSNIEAYNSRMEASPNPVPYTFRVPAPGPKECRRTSCPQHAKAPPFCMQLDHALAVLWCLFRRKAGKAFGEECELGVGQLQWALYFLKGIKPPNGGDRAEDVNIAIQAVEDALLELYADMSDVVMQPPQPGAPFSPGSVPTYGGSVLGSSQDSGAPGAPVSTEPESPCTVCLAKRMKPIIPTWVPTVPVAPCNRCSNVTLGTHKGQGRPRKTGGKKEDTTKPTASSKSRQNMRSKGPSKTRMQNTGPKSSKCTRDPKLEQEIRQLKKAAADLTKRLPGTSQDDDMGHSNEMNMLQEWRKEQVNRVQDELRRLRSLDCALGIECDVTEVKGRGLNNTGSFNPIAASTKRPSVSR